MIYMNDNLWQRWAKDWLWILNIAKKRNWDIVEDLTIKPKVSIEEVNLLMKKLNIKLPNDFIEVITNFSSGVNFYFQIEDSELEEGFEGIFSAGYEGFWSFEDLEILKENYEEWIEICFNDLSDEDNQIWQNKIPIINVANGDLIAFDIKQDSDTYPVVYLSHELGEMHGKRLGCNFIDFITRWSNLGCFGPEDWQFEPFYNEEDNILEIDNDKVYKWKQWLENF